MADALKGMLYFKGEGKNRIRSLRFITPKGKTWNNPINPNKLAPELRNAVEAEIEVELELEAGQPHRIRPVGYPWPETTGLQMQSTHMQDPNEGDKIKREFHNPYNFVPAPPRNTVHIELGDHEPAGHYAFISDKYTGKLCVKMIVKTPLLLPDTAGVSVGDRDHKSFPVRLDESGKPLINPTAIKGMLRSAYEAVTNSRLSVFKDHDQRLAFRMEASEGLRSIPARIEKDPSDDKLYIVLYTGTSKRDGDGTPQKNIIRADKKKYSTMFAAWIRRHKWHAKYPTSKLGGKHGDRVWAYITRWEHHRFDFWNVVEISTAASMPSAPPPAESRKTFWKERRTDGPEKDWRWNNAVPSSTSSGQWVEGFICHTNENIQNKHDERVFFHASSSVEKVILEEQHIKEWKRLIENYYQEHDNGKGGLKDPPEDIKDWSRHIKEFKTTAYQQRDFELQNGTLCYVRGNENAKGGFEIEEIYPVMISRRLHQKPPTELLDMSLHPAELITQLSPADRVFGWVRQVLPKDSELTSDEKRLPKAIKDIGAYRGQIRIGALECKSTDAIQVFGELSTIQSWLPIQILGQPKPQQGRFYVARNKNGDTQNPGLSTEQAGYNISDKGLRGRKMYPHHSNLPTNYWFEANPNEASFENDSPDLTQQPVNTNKPDFFREYVRPKNLNKTTGQHEQQRDNQNRSIQGWVKPGTEFEFDIHFNNLSDMELGALVWLLTLNKNEDDRYFHRFGGGKPLGFGSVRLDWVIDGSDIKSGKEIKEGRYSALDDFSPSIGSIDHIGNFKKRLEEAYDKPFEKIVFIAAFSEVASGFSDLPVHYPRTSKLPNSKGESFEWFVVNNSRDGLKLSLPNLLDDNGLPVIPKK